jgi:hypothetical protein
MKLTGTEMYQIARKKIIVDFRRTDVPYTPTDKLLRFIGDVENYLHRLAQRMRSI